MDDEQAYDPHIRTETAWSKPRDRDWLKTLIENVGVSIPKFKVVRLDYDTIVITLSRYAHFMDFSSCTLRRILHQ